MKVITFNVKAGKVVLQTKGFTGGSCKLASADYEKELGQKVSDKPSSDKASDPEVKNQQQAGLN